MDFILFLNFFFADVISFYLRAYLLSAEGDWQSKETCFRIKALSYLRATSCAHITPEKVPAIGGNVR